MKDEHENRSESDPNNSNEKRVNFPILAQDRGFQGFDFEKEGKWNGSFWFVQCADSQFGMIDSFFNKNRDNSNNEAEIDLCTRLVKKINAVTPKPRFVVVCGDLIDATPITMRKQQIQDFKNVFGQLDPEIKLICVSGNHDVRDAPTTSDIEEYKKDFGDDYFSFWVGGVKFLTINSQYYADDKNCSNLRKKQDEWLANELRTDDTKPRQHLIGFQHIPPFINSPVESRVAVFNHEKLAFNFADMELRRRYLNQLNDAKMSKLFCGHYHRNAGGFDNNLEVVVTTAVGCQLGTDLSGFRVVTVFEKEVKHTFYELDSSLVHINLS